MLFADNAGEVVVIPVDLTEKVDPTAAATLLEPGIVKTSNRQYPTSEWLQFWVVLKRTLLFSRRDWVRSPRFFSLLGGLIFFYNYSSTGCGCGFILQEFVLADADVSSIVCTYSGGIPDWSFVL